MRATSLLLAFLFVPLVIPAGSAQPSDNVCAFEREGTSVTADCDDTIDLIQDGGLVYTVTAKDEVWETPPDDVVAHLDCTCGSFALNMDRVGDVWMAELDIDDPDFVAGTWSISVHGVIGGTLVVQPDTPPTVEVAADDDDGAPQITVLGMDANDTVRLGRGGSVTFDLEEILLRSVSYQIEGRPAFELQNPSLGIGAANFQAGFQNVTLRATDRVGHTAEVHFIVYADTQNPQVSFHYPDRFWAGIPNAIMLDVLEISDFVVRVEAAGEASSTLFAGSPAVQTVQVDVAPTRLGNQSLSIQVTDALGNTARNHTTVVVERLHVDGVLERASQRNMTIAGEPVVLDLRARQGDGRVPLEFDLDVMGLFRQGLLLPVDAGVETNVTITGLSPGVHTGNVSLVAPDGVNETDPSDNNLTVRIEVFMARVIAGEDRYHIRAGPDGLPRVAVGADGTEYNLTLADRGLRSVYTFQAGSEALYWDPAQNVTRVEPSETSGTTTADEGIPGLGALVLVPLAAAAAARRRR